MKTKKTLKRLNKVVALLSNVIDQLPDRKGGLGDVLDSAKANVVRAAKIVHTQHSTGAAKRKPSAKAEERQSAASRKRISATATKRSEADKRKGVNSGTGRALSKTA
jgi:hypothetical protein